MNLFLIGYRCSGKTSVGRQLAEAIHRPFLDTDDLIVQKAGMDISRIVFEKGWGAFRDMERNMIQTVCRKHRQVIATGGGVVLDSSNTALMKSSGRIIWLKVSPQTVKIRLQQDVKAAGRRPSLSGKELMQEIDETLIQREVFYRHAMDFQIEADTLGVAGICKRIIDALPSILSPADSGAERITKK
jgi:shikimate kinase